MEKQSEKILIVNTNDDSLTSLATKLEEEFEVLNVSSTEEALQFLEQNTDVSIIIADQSSPNMQGLEFLELVKNKYPNVARVLATSCEDFQAEVDAVNKDFVGYLIEKPFNIIKIHQFIKEILDTCRLKLDNLQSEYNLNSKKNDCGNLFYPQQPEPKINHHQLGHIFQSVPIILWIVSMDGCIVGANKDLEGNYDNLERLIGRRVYDVLEADVIFDTDLYDIVEKAKTSGQSHAEYMLLKEMKEDLKYLDLTVTKLEDLNGEYFLLFAIKDITTAKKIEKELLDLQEFNESVIQNIPSGILVCNLGFDIILGNKTAGKILGIECERLAGQKIWDVLGEDFEDICSTEQWKLADSIFRSEGVFVHPDGTELIIGYSTAELYNRDGQPVGSIVIFRDVTEIKYLKHRLIQSEKMAGVGILAASIAHEFNNLIGGMMGYAQLAAATDNIEDYHKCVEIVFNASQKAKSIIDNLLGFAKRNRHLIEGILVREMIDQVFTLVEKDLEKAHIRTIKQIDPAVSIRTDVGQVQQVLLNLIINAKHAMPNGGTLSIESNQYDDNTILIAISDTGSEIPQEYRNKIFEPFFRTKSALDNNEIEGTGLGLSLSYGLIKELGGEIVLESDEGVGSKFIIYLSDQGDEDIRPSPDEKISPSIVSGVLNNRSILIVDDEDVIRNLLATILCRNGATVDVAASGYKAIEFLRHKTYDMVFVDLIMPGMDGFETCKAIKELDPSVYLILISGLSGTELENFKGKLNIDDLVFLKKPFELDEIIRIALKQVQNRNIAN